ncbi:MAG: hypothetical protein NTY35_02470 [Planctomycetota bacterium]|nr:hypothetical protein [Planctomycetota bacterium]
MIHLLAISLLSAAQADRSPENLVAPELKPPAPARAATFEEDPGAQHPGIPSIAQETPRELASAPVSGPCPGLHVDTTSAGEVWVRGQTYKAQFRADAARYVPFLGSHAPRNYPLELRVESVTIGGEPLAFDAVAPAVRDGDSIVYERGPFRERYLLAPDSVEQTFEFDDLPRRGEIVIRLAVETDLRPEADAEGFTYSNELGGVRYGRAFVFHDELARTAVDSRLVGDRIEITAPASIVEHAQGRFVIDPVVSTYPIADGLADEFAPDSAYDGSLGTFLTVSEQVFSATDHDILAVRHGTGGTITNTAYVDLTGDDWRAPAVANHRLDDQFLVVAARGTAPTRTIWGRTVEATVSLNMSAQFQVSSGIQTGDASAPDVGADPSTNLPAYYFVVWEREFQPGLDYDILGRLVQSNGVLVASVFVDNTAGTIHRNPSVSSTNGDIDANDQKWNVVWEEEVSPTNRNILGARVRWDGVVTDPTFTVASSALDERNPSATPIIADTGVSRPWMVAYQIDGGADGWDVRCRTFNGTSIVTTLDLSDQFGTPSLDQVTPSCDTAVGEFLVAYDEHPQGFYTVSDIKVSTLFTINGSLAVNEGNVSVSPGLHLEARPRIAPIGQGLGANVVALVVYDRDVGGPNDVMGTLYEVPFGVPSSSFCAGDGSGTACPCGNAGAPGNGCASSVNPSGAQLAWSGNARVVSDDFQLQAAGLPATAPVLFFQGTSQSVGGAGSVFGDGLRCASGTVIRLATKTASAGSAVFPEAWESNVSVRGAIPAIGGVRYYQAWYRNSAAFCTASTFNLTNGVRTQWVP